MGARGPGAKPTRKDTSSHRAKKSRKPRWQWRGLSRAERVIAFVQALEITSGPFAGLRLKLRPWQKDIVRALYATDAGGQRIVRTGLVTMPRKNGYELLKEVRSNHGISAEMPFIFLSALADKEHVVAGLKLGADNYMTKPVDFDVLRVKVKACLRQVARIRDTVMTGPNSEVLLDC